MNTPLPNDNSGRPGMGVGVHWNDIEVGDRLPMRGRAIAQADIARDVAAVRAVERISTGSDTSRRCR